jgi:hypothetical protein
MPSATEHHNKVEHNRAFVDYIGKADPPFRDWAITGMFYMAVHQVERYFDETVGQHCPNHTVRDTWVCRSLRSIYQDYRDLKDLSIAARYDVVSMTSSDVKDAEVLLETIENEIESLL